MIVEVKVQIKINYNYAQKFIGFCPHFIIRDFINIGVSILLIREQNI